MKKLNLFLLVVFVIFSLGSCKKDMSSPPPANVPAISSFSPASGTEGTTVTITGTNFSATITDNTVSFNGKPAIITSSTVTQIIATVPPGATTGKITVKVSATTATSSTDFTVPVVLNKLSEARTSLTAAALGNKIFFAGGYNGTSAVKTIDIYDAGAGSWSTAQLSVARLFLTVASTGSKIVFAGGQTGIYPSYQLSAAVDIYDSITGQWTTATLSRAQAELSSGAAGNKIIFGGGMSSIGPSDTVDIYDVSTNTWTVHRLPELTLHPAIAGAGNKILIAGGDDLGLGRTDRVDIYDVVTGLWTVSHLSEPRYRMCVAAIGNKIIFSGGALGTDPTETIRYFSKTVDIYDVTTGTWSTSQLNEEMCYIIPNYSAAASGNIAMISRGFDFQTNGNGSITDNVDVFNITTNTWTQAHLSNDRTGTASAAAANKIVIAGGDNFTIYNTVDIYDVLTGTWVH